MTIETAIDDKIDFLTRCIDRCTPSKTEYEQGRQIALTIGRQLFEDLKREINEASKQVDQ